MINTPSNNQARLRPDASKAPKTLPRLSLNLHTMPPTASQHWQKWLVTGIAFLVVVALTVFALLSL